MQSDNLTGFNSVSGYFTRLSLLTALSHLIHTQPYEAGTNVSLLWIRKEGLSLRNVTPSPLVGWGAGYEICFSPLAVSLLSEPHEARARIVLDYSGNIVALGPSSAHTGCASLTRRVTFWISVSTSVKGQQWDLPVGVFKGCESGNHKMHKQKCSVKGLVSWPCVHRVFSWRHTLPKEWGQVEMENDQDGWMTRTYVHPGRAAEVTHSVAQYFAKWQCSRDSVRPLENRGGQGRYGFCVTSAYVTNNTNVYVDNLKLRREGSAMEACYSGN